MKLTQENYYSPEANREFMSVSQYKDFCKCEAMAMAKINGEYKEESSQALFLGSFVDEMLTGTKESQINFIVQNRSAVFQKSSKLNKLNNEGLTDFANEHFLAMFGTECKPYAEIVQALDTIERIKKQPLMMKHFNSEHQVIMTGKIADVPFKIKMDNYKPGEFISDGKYMKSLRSPNMFESMVKYWGYDKQGAVYQEIVHQNTSLRLPFFLDIATKEEPAHLDVAEVNQYDLDEKLEEVKKNVPRYQAIKNGEIEPERCEEYDCPYCTATKIITEPIDSNYLGMSAKQLKIARGEV